MFCSKCKGLLQRTLVRGKPSGFCPRCDGAGTRESPQVWWAKEPVVEAAKRSSDAARAAVSSRPDVPSGPQGRRPRGVKVDDSDVEGRPPKVLPPPDKLELPAGLDLFPFDLIREGQREFVRDVADAAEKGRHLLAHAPTGLGKTVSTLAPFVAYAIKHNKRVFFLTSKQSQHKIAIDTLKAIRRKAGVPFVVSDIIGKQDMCPRREARDLFPRRFSEFCRREQVSHQCEYWETANQQAVRFLKREVLHVEEVVIEATDHGVCPHQAAMDLAAQAHVVVCDYNYLFSDLREGIQERLRLDLADVLLVVDEAHNLPDRIRDHLTLSLSEHSLGEAVEEARELDDPALAKRIEMLADAVRVVAEAPEEPRDGEDRAPAGRGERYVTRAQFVDAVNETFESTRRTLTSTDFEGLLSELKLAQDAYLERVKAESRALAGLHEFLSNWKIERRGLARILSKDPTPSLSYRILDPSVIARPVFEAVHASVVMSGTLHPMEMIRDVLGIDAARASLREYESPFPRENRLVLVDAAVTTGYKERTPEMFRMIGERLAGIAHATPGHVAAFFPSYAILEDVRPHVEAALGARKALVVEERSLDKSAKEGLVQRLRGLATRTEGDALLMGVQGGSLSEGYDYADNLLKAVVIVGLPFAAPTLEVEALISYYNTKFGPGLGRPYGYVHPTFHRVLQAAGRCIRGPEDRGVIVLMDKRFGWGTYRESYPRDFRPVPTQDPVRAIERFWRGS